MDKFAELKQFGMISVLRISIFSCMLYLVASFLNKMYSIKNYMLCSLYGTYFWTCR